MRQPRHVGITLVELLVVIGIIGVLIALLLPAIQAAREAARNVTCRSHLKQLGSAMHNHHEQYRRFPSGGWGYLWVGDPDRGTDRRQPGGWVYNLLTYIEQSELRDVGRGDDASEKRDSAATAAQRPIDLFNCPSRRASQLYPYLEPRTLRNSAIAANVAKSDYAINGGDVGCGQAGPRSLTEGDRRGYDWGNISEATGICYLRSEVSIKHVSDGTSHTYMIGEKYGKTSGYDQGDDQHMFVGHDCDTLRYTTIDRPPLPDGEEEYPRRFGSAHAGGCNFLFVDGSVHTIDFDISPETHRRLGNRKDGLPIGGDDF